MSFDLSNGMRSAALLARDLLFVALDHGLLRLGGRRQADLLVDHLVHRGHDVARQDRKSTRLNSSHSQISYAVFCLKKKKHQHASEIGCIDRGTHTPRTLRTGNWTHVER